MKIGITPADQQLAQIDVALAKRLGEAVDPRVELIARADSSRVNRHFATSTDSGSSSPVRVWLDEQTGDVVGVGPTPPKDA
ncbi:MAG: hypothetical protein WA962_01180 [Ornithinimicrobium sp.]